MPEQTPPPSEPLQTGYETRDLSIPLVVASAMILALAGVALAVTLGQVLAYMLPAEEAGGAAPPAEMPGEAPVNDRIRAVPPPRLEPLRPLEAQPPFRSSRPPPGDGSRTQRPEDLRADRQPALAGYGWVERGTVARIPIGRAMDAVVEMERAKAKKKEGGK